MIIFPAIDIKDKKCVRLSQGRFDQVTIYDENPVKVAKSFEKEGAAYLHIVDLNGAGDETSSNEIIIKEIAQTIRIPIQVGGGIRTLEKVERLLGYGISRVIVGTIAIENNALLLEMILRYPKQIVVSLDAKDGFIQTRGWKSETKINAFDFAVELEQLGIDTIVYTDIKKDGMLSGPSFEDYKILKDKTSLNIIASGGISQINDLIKLNELGLYGAITGKALYEKRFTLKEAITCLQSE